MIYFRYLNLDWKPASDKIKIYLQQHPEVIHPDLGAWVMAPKSIFNEVPELTTMFSPLKIDPIVVGFFVTRYKVGAIHIDQATIPIRINFPILNCDNTETKFYKVKGQSEEKLQPNGRGWIKFDPEQCHEVDSFRLTKAVVMKVLEPHRVISYTDNLPRISCTVAFKQDLNFLLTD